MTSVTKDQLDNLAPFLEKYSDAELAVDSIGVLVARSRSAKMGCFGDYDYARAFPYSEGGGIDSARPLTDEEQEALGLISEAPEPSVDKFEVNEDGTVITWMGETYVLEGAYPSLAYVHLDAIDDYFIDCRVEEADLHLNNLFAREALRRIEG